MSHAPAPPLRVPRHAALTTRARPTPLWRSAACRLGHGAPRTPQVEAQHGAGEFFTPRGQTRVKRNKVLTYKTYFEQFSSWARARLNEARAGRGPGHRSSQEDGSVGLADHARRSATDAHDAVHSGQPLAAPRGGGPGNRRSSNGTSPGTQDRRGLGPDDEYLQA